jgi:hypothetical protein
MGSRASFTLPLLRWRRHVPPNRRFTFNGLTRSYIQKTEFFITTAVRRSNCIYKNRFFGICGESDMPNLRGAFLQHLVANGPKQISPAATTRNKGSTTWYRSCAAVCELKVRFNHPSHHHFQSCFQWLMGLLRTDGLNFTLPRPTCLLCKGRGVAKHYTLRWPEISPTIAGIKLCFRI